VSLNSLMLVVVGSQRPSTEKELASELTKTLDFLPPGTISHPSSRTDQHRRTAIRCLNSELLN
jgi:hypothetical protein